MNTAKYVDDLIAVMLVELREKKISRSEAAWKVAMACLYWAYVFGAYGDYCDPSNRRSRYRAAHPEIKNKCKNFNGRDDVPAGCVGCKWFLGTAESDESVHEGRTRFFDCRGYIYYVLDKLFNAFGGKCPAGCTTMWNTAKYWEKKGTVKEGVPNDILVCLFKQDPDNPKKMAHIGFSYHGETLECSCGVEYYPSRNKKWTHWAVPVCVCDDTPVPPSGKPTLRKGDKGEYVTLMQTELIQKGYNCGDTGADGKFGNNTEKALKRFQKDNGLVEDGICGDSTWEALESKTILYTVTIPNLPKYHADALVTNYPGAYMTEERG